MCFELWLFLNASKNLWFDWKIKCYPSRTSLIVTSRPAIRGKSPRMAWCFGFQLHIINEDLHAVQQGRNRAGVPRRRERTQGSRETVFLQKQTILEIVQVPARMLQTLHQLLVTMLPSPRRPLQTELRVPLDSLHQNFSVKTATAPALENKPPELPRWDSPFLRLFFSL